MSATRRRRWAWLGLGATAESGDGPSGDGLAERLRRDAGGLGSPSPSLRRRVLGSVHEVHVETPAPLSLRVVRLAAAVFVVALAAWALVIELDPESVDAPVEAVAGSAEEPGASERSAAMGGVAASDVARNEVAPSEVEEAAPEWSDGDTPAAESAPVAVTDPPPTPAEPPPTLVDAPLATLDAPLATSDPPLMGAVALGRLPFERLSTVDSSVLFTTVEQPLLDEAARIRDDAAATAGFVVEQVLRALTRLTPAFWADVREL